MLDGPLNILLVEDNEDDYLILRDLLADIDPERFALEWADAYADGLRAIQTRRHDLVLLDFRLSDGTGLELLRETEALPGRAPVILMTGQGDRDIDRQAMQAGAADYLVKDHLDADRLERAIRYAVEHRRAAEALRASEERYRKFIEASTEGIWRFELERPLPTDLPEAEQIAHLDRYAYVAECNDAMAHIYGFESAAELVGAHFSEFLWGCEVGDDNYPRRLIRNAYRLVSVEAFEQDRFGRSKYVLHNLAGFVEGGLLYRFWETQIDITDRKRAEHALAQLAAIVDTSDDAIFSKTVDGQIVTWNKGAEALYGYTAQEVTGRHVSLLSATPIPPRVRHIQERVAVGERVPQFESSHRHKSGALIDVSLAVSPIIDAEGRVTGSATIARDITERKRAEAALARTHAALAESEARFRASVDAMDEGLILQDAEGRILFCNGSAERILGLSADQMRGLTSLDPRWRAVREDGTAFAGDQRPATVALREGVPQCDVVMGVHKPDGELTWVNVNAVPLMAETGEQETGEQETGETAPPTGETADAGRPRGVVVTFSDITERKRAETRLRRSEASMAAAQRVAHFGSWELELSAGDGFSAHPLRCSDETFRIFGYEPDPAPVTTDFFFRGIPPEEQAPIREAVSEAIAGRWPYSLVHRVRRPDGAERVVRETGQFFDADASGQPPRLVGTVHDITEQQQAEEHTHFTASLLSQVRNAVVATDPAGRITYWNDFARALYQWTAEEAVGRSVAELIIPPESREAEERRRRRTQDEGVWEGEMRVRRKDGGTFPAYVATALLRDAQGVVTGRVSVGIDITEMKRAEAALAESRQRLALATEAAGLGIWDWDIAADRLLWDDRMYALYGIREQDSSGAYDAWQRGLHPDDRAGAEAEVAAALDGTGEFHTQFRVVWPDGEVRHIEAHGTVLRADDGTARRMTGINRDITERKQAEEALLLRDSAIQASGNGIVVSDMRQPGRPLVSVNPAFERMTGYSAAEVLGRDCRLLQGPDRDQPALATVRAALEAGRPASAVLRNYRKDGSPFWNELFLSPIRDAGGTLTHYVGVQSDITERKQAEEERDRIEAALREAEHAQRQLVAWLEVERARLAEAQAIAKVGSWELDLVTDTLTWSSENHRIFGVDLSRFGGTYAAFLERVHPDDRAALDRKFHDCLDGRGPCEADHRIVMDDGAVKFIHERWQTFYDDGGRPLRSVGTTQDVTDSRLTMEALRQSEHEFRRMVETTHEGVVQVDADARITYVNQRYCDMLGYTAGELLGRSVFDFMDDESRAQALRGFDRRRDGVTEQFDRRLRHKDGSVVWAIVSVSPLLDGAGRMVGSLSMTTDITERKRLEAQMHRSEKLAALGELVAGVAHEINNPLAAILGNAELLQMHPDPQVCEDAQAIQRMGERVTRIVRSLLTFSRPQQRGYRQEAVNAMVQDTLEMTRHKLRTGAVSLALHLSEPSPVASADANEIQQIFLNLIVNAEHALRQTEGEKRIDITTGVERIDGRDWATVSVADSGCGIPEEIRTRIFDPFFTTKEVGEGTGLGLSICHGIAKAHGGRLSVESAVGFGTTFTLALPSAAPA